MTRFHIKIENAIEMVHYVFDKLNGGEILIPKMKNFKIKTLANEISKSHKIIGLRQGEKLEEILLTEEEKHRSIEKENMWIIKPHK